MENDLWLPMTIGQSCRHNVSAAYTVCHCQLLCSVVPLRNYSLTHSVWIQWTTEFRVTLLLNCVWDSRVGLAGTLSRSLVQSVDILTTVTVRVNWNKNFNSKVSPWYRELRLSLTTWCRIQSFKSTASICTLTTLTTPTQHVHPDGTIYDTLVATPD